MSSAGHVLDMIARMKANDSLKKAKREQRRKLNELFHKEGLHLENNAIWESEISPDAREKVKENIHHTSIRERRSGLIYSPLSVYSSFLQWLPLFIGDFNEHFVFLGFFVSLW